MLQSVHFLKGIATLSGEKEDEQINLYAGHDISIEAILLVLDHPLDHHVPFAARLVFEEWIMNDGQKLIRFITDLDGIMDHDSKNFSIYANGTPIRQFWPLDEFSSFIDAKFEHLFKVPFSWENYETGNVRENLI